MAKPITIALKRHLKRAVIQTGLEAISFASNLGLLSHAGLGAIFTLHRVEPEPTPLFDPSAHLTVTPDFLEGSIKKLLDQGYEAIALKDVPERIKNPDPDKRFMVFTLDDGYKNNIEYALPVFKKYNVPFTIFACAGFVSREHSIWWETTQELVSKVDHLNIDIGCGAHSFPTSNIREKYAAFDQIGRDMLKIEQKQAVEKLDQIARQNSVEPLDIVNNLIMNEAELVALDKEPLADIGAHTISHANLAKLERAELIDEIDQSRAYIADLTGSRPTHFAFPYGKLACANEREFDVVRELGFDVAVTTEPDVVRADAKDSIHHLKRISLNGYYQKTSYLDALISGAAFKYHQSKFRQSSSQLS